MPRPKTVLCYICGREFSPHSIDLHERQCAKRWETASHREKENNNYKGKQQNGKSIINTSPKPRLIAGSQSSTTGKDEEVPVPEKSPDVADEKQKMPGLVRTETVTIITTGSEQGSLNNNTLSSDSCSVQSSGSETEERKMDDSQVGPYSPDKVETAALKRGSRSLLSLADIPSFGSNAGTVNPFPETRFHASKMPNMQVCYICGRGFGVKSIAIHEPQCLKKWKMANPRRASNASSNSMKKARSVSSIAGAGESTTTTIRKTSFQQLQSPLWATAVQSKSCSNLADQLSSSGCSSDSCSVQSSGSENDEQKTGDINKEGISTKLSHSTNDTNEGVADPIILDAGFHSPKKPAMQICYICGREFGLKSIAIHEPQCLKKWKIANPERASSDGRSPIKKAQSVSSLARSRKSVTAKDRKASFQPPKSPLLATAGQSRSCSNLAGNLRSPSVNQKSSGQHKPSMTLCYICGREFSHHSISIHEKQCLKKWEAQKKGAEAAAKGPTPWKKKVTPRTRRSVPNIPIEIRVENAEQCSAEKFNASGNQSTDVADVKRSPKPSPKRNASPVKNEAASRMRRSVPSIPVAIKIEDTENENGAESRRKAWDSPSEAQGISTPSPTRNSPSIVVCYLCGRQYGSASISIHEKQCQKKWQAESARKAELERRFGSKKRERTRPKSFVL